MIDFEIPTEVEELGERVREFVVLALWKSAIFLEGSYRRFTAGESEDPFFGRLDVGVPALARAALGTIGDPGD